MKLRTRLIATAAVPIFVLLANIPLLWILASRHDRVVEDRSLLWSVAQNSVALEGEVAALRESDAPRDARERLGEASSALLGAVDSLAGSATDGEVADSLRLSAERQIEAAAAFADELAGPQPERSATPLFEDAAAVLANRTRSTVATAVNQIADLERRFEIRQSRLTTSIQLLALLAVVMIVTTTVTIRRRIAVGIDRLSRFADAVGRGDLTYRSHLRGPDEVGELGELLDVMAARVQESLKDIELFSRAVEQSPVAVAVTDLDGVIEFVNPKFSEMTGFAADEALGRKPSILSSGYHSREFYETLWATILGGEPWRGELVNQKRTGETEHSDLSFD